jgi:hypothetical protein
MAVTLNRLFIAAVAVMFFLIFLATPVTPQTGVDRDVSRALGERQYSIVQLGDLKLPIPLA